MTDVRLYNGKRPLIVSLENVFKIMKIIASSGNEESFLEVCRKRNLCIEVDKSVVNAVKSHLANASQRQESLAAQVQQSVVEPGSPPTCFPKIKTKKARRNRPNGA